MIKYPLSAQKELFSLSKSSFTNFLNPFLDTSSKSLVALISKCNFNKFYDHAISFNSFDNFSIFNENYYSYHEYFSIGKLNINICSFKNCRSRGSSGGAIFSICPTTIHESYFYYCFSDSGGAFCIFSDINISNTIVYRCSSINGGCFSGKFGNLYIDACSFSFCTSSVSGGAINYVESNELSINNINCSYCTSDSHSSTFYLIGKFLIISNSITSFSESLSGIGGICIFNHNIEIKIKMESCVFSKMKAKEISTSIYLNDMLDYSNSEIAISKCYFYKCSEKNKISSIHNSRISSSILIGCFFTSSLEVELGNSKFSQDNNFFDCNNDKFNLKKIPKRKFFIAPHPYILPMEYVIEFVSAIKSSVLFSLYFATLILSLYEIKIVCKKVKINKIK